MTKASMEMSRRTMAQDKNKGRQEAEAKAEPNNQAEEQQGDGIDQVLSAGLRKLYDPILEEQVPSEMLEILKRGRKRS